MLTPKQIRFAHAVAEDDGRSNAKCAIDAGYTEKSAPDMAYHNLRNAEVQDAIKVRKAELAAAAGVTVALVLREWMQVATADATEIMRAKVTRCPACWPMSERELPPNPRCAACKGAGERTIIIADTESLSPAARRLIAGYKQTKDGIEVKLRDQDAAWSKLADYLGMLNKGTTALTGPGGGPVQVLTATPADLTDDQLTAIAAAGESATLGVSEGVVIDGEPLSLPLATA